MRFHEGKNTAAHQEKDAHARKNYFGGWKYLQSRYQSEVAKIGIDGSTVEILITHNVILAQNVMHYRKYAR